MSSLKFRKGGSPKKKGGYAGPPPEPCGIQPARNSVVTLAIPYGTPRAKEIREWLHTKVLNQDGLRMFYYRSDNEEWTNIDLKSTADAPLLTAPPVYAVEKAYDVLKACPAVSTVSIVDEDDNPLTLAQARARPPNPPPDLPRAQPCDSLHVTGKGIAFHAVRGLTGRRRRGRRG